MINELDKVDFMVLDEIDKSKLILAITDHLEWRSIEREHLLLLQEKLNNYINYILDEGYKDTYKEKIDRFQIIIYMQHEPRRKLEKLLDQIRKLLAKQFPDAQIEISYQLVKDEDQ